MDLELIKSDKFNGVTCDFYSSRDNEIWMTREQIGRALEYENPNNAIAVIHRRYKDRLDKFSRVCQIDTPFGGKQEMYLYSAKGVYEILRWSRQPKANAFYDWVYEMLEALRTGRATLTPGLDKLIEQNQQMMQAMTAFVTETSKSLTTMASGFADLRERVEKLEAKNPPGVANMTTENAVFDIQNKCKVELLPAEIRAQIDEMLAAEKINYSYISRVITAQKYSITSPAIKKYHDKMLAQKQTRKADTATVTTGSKASYNQHRRKIDTFPAPIRAIINEMLKEKKKNFAHIARVISAAGYQISSEAISKYYNRCELKSKVQSLVRVK